MLRSYRSVFIAFVGLALLCGVHGPDEGQAAQNTEQGAQQPATERTSVTAAAQQGATPAPISDLANPARDQSYYAREDLKAQQIMAEWTRYMGLTAVAGVLLSLVGVILVFTTFAATRHANRITLAGQRPWLNFELSQVRMLHEASVTYDIFGEATRSADPEIPPVIHFQYKLVNTGNSPAYDIDWRSTSLKGEWQVDGEPDIYAPNDARYFERVVPARKSIFIKSLMPGETAEMHAYLPITTETMSTPDLGAGVRLLPRYASFATYQGSGIERRGETGKVFTFHVDDPGNFVPNDGTDHNKRKVEVSIALRATHVV